MAQLQRLPVPVVPTDDNTVGEDYPFDLQVRSFNSRPQPKGAPYFRVIQFRATFGLLGAETADLVDVEDGGRFPDWVSHDLCATRREHVVLSAEGSGDAPILELFELEPPALNGIDAGTKVDFV